MFALEGDFQEWMIFEVASHSFYDILKQSAQLRNDHRYSYLSFELRIYKLLRI